MEATTEDKLMSLFEKFELLLLPPDVLVDTISAGQEFKAEKIYLRLVALKKVPACITFNRFLESVKIWHKWELKEKNDTLFLKRL